MNKALILSVLAVLLVGLVAVGVLAMPFGEKGQRGNMLPGNDAAKAALDAGDYAAFAAAVKEDGNAGRWSELTEEQFNKMVEQQKEMETKRAAMQEQMDAVNAALDAGDYSAWQKAISGLKQAPGFAEKITEENFDIYVKLHQAQKEVRKLAEELGIDGPGMKLAGPGIGPGNKQGMGRMGPGFQDMGPGNRTGNGRMHPGMNEMGSFGPEMPAP